MFERNLWALAVAAGWAMVMFLHAQAVPLTESAQFGAEIYRWICTGGYFALGGLLVAAVMRLLPALTPSLGRAYAVLGGAALAGIEAWLLPPPPGITRLDAWMAGLLGLVLAALAVRLVPASVACAWMGRPERGPRF